MRVNSLLDHPALLSPRSPAISGSNSHSANPYRECGVFSRFYNFNTRPVSMLATPLRLCAVSRFKFPSALLLRFKVVNGVLCTDKEARRHSHKSQGKGLSVICRKSAVEYMLADKLWQKLSRKATVRIDLVEAVERELVDNVIYELDKIFHTLRSNCLKQCDDVLMSNKAPWLMYRQTRTKSTQKLTAGLVINLTHTGSFSRITQGTHRPPLYTFDEKHTAVEQFDRLRKGLAKIEEHLQRRGCDTGDPLIPTFAFGFGCVSDGQLSIDLVALSVALWRCRMWHESALQHESFGLHAQDSTIIR